MSRNWTTTFLAACMTVFVAGAPAVGQSLREAEFFRPFEATTYGGERRASEGFYFTFDPMALWISTPEITDIGLDGAVREDVFFSPSTQGNQANSHDTGFISSGPGEGTRYEFGVISGHDGFFVSGFFLRPRTQTLGGRFGSPASDVSVVFNDAPFGNAGLNHLVGPVDEALTIQGDLPVIFDEAVVESKVEAWGVEWMYLYRAHPGKHGAIWELFGGVRYFEFNDQFGFNGFSTLVAADDPAATPPPAPAVDVETDFAFHNTLNESNWLTRADNRVVGPQVGARMAKTHGNWKFSSEGRFFAGFNSQSVSQSGVLGTDLDPATPTLGLIDQMSTSTFNHSANFSEWSPAFEVQIALECQLTRAISIGGGWNGFWMDGIARSSNMINYDIPSQAAPMGINGANNRQDIFVNGPFFRISVNR